MDLWSDLLEGRKMIFKQSIYMDKDMGKEMEKGNWKELTFRNEFSYHFHVILLMQILDPNTT